MKSLIETPPKTVMEVYKNLPEGTLAELIENVIYMSPSPVTIHQKVLQLIFRRLSESIEDQGRGEVFVSAFDVYLDDLSNAVQPDILVIMNGNTGQLNPNGHFHGVPDFIVEILSPGNKDHDLIKKKELYERFGVKEYWVVDPQTKQVQGFELRKNTYQLLFEGQSIIQSALLNLSFNF
jgi:Uma2 family endonuclease